MSEELFSYEGGVLM